MDHRPALHHDSHGLVRHGQRHHPRKHVRPPQLTASFISNQACMSPNGTFRKWRDVRLESVKRLPAQPVDATQALNLSAGVSNSKVLRGRSFS
jgi:hypothetical protein